MGEIVNLRMARKRKARAQGEKAAGENRLLHGRSKAERSATKGENQRAEAAHEAHRRERPEPGEDR